MIESSSLWHFEAYDCGLVAGWSLFSQTSPQALAGWCGLSGCAIFPIFIFINQLREKHRFVVAATLLYMYSRLISSGTCHLIKFLMSDSSQQGRYYGRGVTHLGYVR